MIISSVSENLFFRGSDFREIRRKIQAGAPVGPLDVYGLVQVPEDVFIIKLEDSEPYLQENSDTHSSIQADKDKLINTLDNSRGKVGVFWEKTKQKIHNPQKAVKALCGFLGVGGVLSVGNNIQGNILKTAGTVNGKIDSIFDRLNDKIKDLSFDKINDTTDKLAEIANNIDSDDGIDDDNHNIANDNSEDDIYDSHDTANSTDEYPGHESGDCTDNTSEYNGDDTDTETSDDDSNDSDFIDTDSVDVDI